MITIKEELVGGDKYRRALEIGGANAIVMWLALKAYVAEHLTDGFIPDEEIQRLRGAPGRHRRRALTALLECGRLLEDGRRSAGLVDRSAHGWRLHDYLDHAECSLDLRLRREREADRKRRYRAKKRSEYASAVQMSHGGHETGRDGGQRDTPVPASARTDARDSCARARPQPTPAHPSLLDQNKIPPTPQGEDSSADRGFAKQARQVFDYWIKARGKRRVKLTTDRRRKVEARLREGYSVEDICAAIDGVARSPHHRGENDTGQVWDDLTLICRSGSKVETFRDMPGGAHGAKPPPTSQLALEPPEDATDDELSTGAWRRRVKQQESRP